MKKIINWRNAVLAVFTLSLIAIALGCKEPSGGGEGGGTDTTAPSLNEKQDVIEKDSKNYMLRFTENISVVNDNEALKAGITYKVGEGQSNRVSGASINTADTSVIDIEFPSTFRVGVDDTVTISIKAGIVKDAAGNQNAAASTSAITVADKTGPKPLSEQDGLSSVDTAYIIRFDEALTPVGDSASLTAGITYTANGGTEKSVSTATIDGTDPTQINITLDSPIAANAKVVFKIAAGIVQDAAGNKNAAESMAAITIKNAALPHLESSQDELSDADTEYTLRYNKALTLATTGNTALAQGITFTVNGGTATTAVAGAAIDSTDAKLLKITFSSSFNAGEAVEFTIAAGLVKNDENRNNAEEKLSRTVADKTMPNFATTQNTLDDSMTAFKLKFTEEVRAVASDADLAAGIKYEIGSSGTSTAVAKASIDGADRTLIDIEFPHFDAGAEVVFSLEADLVADDADNKNVAISTDPITVADKTRPKPLLQQDGLNSVDTAYIIRFDEALTLAVADDIALAKGITYTANGGTEKSVSTAKIDGTDPTQINITLDSPIAANAKVVFKIAADIVQDAAENKNAAVSMTAITVKNADLPYLESSQDELSDTDTEYTLRYNRALTLATTDNTALAQGITFTVDSGTTTTAVAGAAIDSTDAKLLKITFSNSFNAGEAVEFTIAAGLVKNDENRNNAEEKLSRTVADKTKPGLATTQNTLDDTMTAFKLRFTEEVRAVASDADLAAGIKYTVVNSGITAQVSKASINDVDRTLIDIEFPHFDAGADVVFSLEAELVADDADNKNVAISTDPITVADKTRPKPLLQQDGLDSVDTAYIIRFDEALTLAVADDIALAKGITYTANGGAEISIKSATIDGADPTQINITLDSPIAANAKVVFKIAADIVQDAAENKNAAASMAEITIKEANLPHLESTQDELSDADTEYTLKYNVPLTLATTDNTVLAQGITFTVDSGTTTTAVAGAAIDSTDAKLLKITFSSSFNAGEAVEFTIAAGLVKNDENRNNVEEKLSRTVADKTMPNFATTQNTLDDSMTAFQLKFTEELVREVADDEALAAGIKYVIGSSGTSTAVDKASIDGADRTLISIEIPHFDGGAKVVFSLDPALVADEAGNQNAAISLAPITVTDIPYLLDNQGELGNSFTQYTFQFDEALTRVATDDTALARGITYTVDGGTATAVGTAAIDGTDSSRLIITFTNPFMTGEEVVFTIAADLLQNATGNNNTALGLTKTVIDTTRPSIESMQEASLDDTMMSFQLKFSEELMRAVADDAALANGIKYDVGSSGTFTPVSKASIDSTDSSLLNIEFPRFDADAKVVFSIDADLVSDAAGNINEAKSTNELTVADTPPQLLPEAQQDPLYELDLSYKLRFNQNVELNVSGSELRKGITISIDGGQSTHPIPSRRNGYIHPEDKSIIIIGETDHDFGWNPDYYGLPVTLFTGMSVQISLGQGMLRDATGNEAPESNFSKEVKKPESGESKMFYYNSRGPTTTLTVDNGMLAVHDSNSNQMRLVKNFNNLPNPGNDNKISHLNWAATRLALSDDGDIYAVSGHKILKFTLSADKSSLAKSTVAGDTGGFKDGNGKSAQFNTIGYIALDHNEENIFIADSKNHRIRKMNISTGDVTTIAGTGAKDSVINGPGSTATFNEPSGIAVASDGSVYVSDAGNYLIRKLTPDASTNPLTYTVSTIAGTGTKGKDDGDALAATFNSPEKLAIDSGGVLYLYDGIKGEVRIIDPRQSSYTVRTYSISTINHAGYFIFAIDKDKNDGAIYVATYDTVFKHYQ